MMVNLELLKKENPYCMCSHAYVYHDDNPNLACRRTGCDCKHFRIQPPDHPTPPTYNPEFTLLPNDVYRGLVGHKTYGDQTFEIHVGVYPANTGFHWYVSDPGYANWHAIMGWVPNVGLGIQVGEAAAKVWLTHEINPVLPERKSDD